MALPGHLRVYHYIKVIARVGSFSAAAGELNIAVSALSRWVNNVEADLGTSLFRRMGRGLELTEAGQAYLEHANLMLDSDKTIRDRLQQLARGEWGTVKIASVEGAGETIVPAAIAEICKEYPQIDFELEIGNPDVNLKHLLNRDVDFGLFLNQPQDANLSLVFEYPAPISVEMREGHPLSGKKNLTMRDVADYPILLPSKDTSIYQMVHLAFSAEKLTLQSNVKSNSILSQRQIISETDYLSFGSKLLYVNWARTTLRPIKNDILKQRKLSCYRLKDHPLSSATQLFIQSLRKQIELNVSQ